jgi:hypothetical protein
LHEIGLDRERASVLLTHAPDHPEIAEAGGISLQLSGRTHLGQFIPWNWMARRIYRQFVYGLSRIGNMQVFTSSEKEPGDRRSVWDRTRRSSCSSLNNAHQPLLRFEQMRSALSKTGGDPVLRSSLSRSQFWNEQTSPAILEVAD